MTSLIKFSTMAQSYVWRHKLIAWWRHLNQVKVQATPSVWRHSDVNHQPIGYNFSLFWNEDVLYNCKVCDRIYMCKGLATTRHKRTFSSSFSPSISLHFDSLVFYWLDSSFLDLVRSNDRKYHQRLGQVLPKIQNIWSFLI